MEKISRVPDVFQRRSATFLLWLFLGALLAAGLGIVVFERYIAEKRSTKTDSESLIVRSITESDHVIGEISAPVQVVVYADLSCPYCKRFFESTLPRLQAVYGDTIVVAFRHLPLAQHKRSRLEANAAECIASLEGNDAFWRYVRKIYEQPDYEQGLAIPKLVSLADGDGESRAHMTTCIESGEHDARVRTDMLEAAVAGMSVTPSIVLKSATRALIVKGDYYSQLDTGIEYLLGDSI
jgi:protein-disulfide isomerase